MKKIILIILCLFSLSSIASGEEIINGVIQGGGGSSSSIGTLTNGKWCTSDGSVINCTTETPAGAGDVVGPAATTQYKIPLWGADSKTLIDGVAVGTEGQLLRSAGAGANPAWSAYTLALPGAAGAILYSDGTNWTRSATPSFQALTLTGNNTLALGTSSSTTGAVVFNNAATSKMFTITSGETTVAADIGWTLPTAAPGGANYLLNVDADGTMGYTDPAVFSTLSGTNAFTGTNTFSNGTSSAGSILFKEDGDNGTNTAQLIGPASTADVVITLPATTGTVALTGKVELTAAPGSDHTVSGTVATMTAGENLAIGDVCYRKSDGKWWKADADAAASMPALAMATDTISADATGVFLLNGFIRDDTWDLTVGGLVYAGSGATSSHTAGAINQAAPNGSGDQVQVIGIAYSADVIYFCPSINTLELT